MTSGHKPQRQALNEGQDWFRTSRHEMTCVSDADANRASLSTFEWLLRLRWCAVVGQTATVVVVDQGLHIDLPLLPLFGFICVTAVSNLAASVRVRAQSAIPAWLAGALMSTDVAALTALLMITGGAGNPFASFYLVHATMAAMVLSVRATWMIWAFCSAGYALLFVLRHSLTELHHHAICGPAMNYDLHLHGMLVSLVLTAAAIAYFVSRVLRALRLRETELSAARVREVENERFASLATLAAGVAHEIGSPLGTIAVAAGELRRASEKLPTGNTIRDDAELIAEEVARCRAILDRLSDRSGAMGDQPRTVTVAEVLAGVRQTLPASELARLHCDDSELPLTMTAPPLALVQGLGVLVKNAFDASPANEPVRVSVARSASEVRFMVDDCGTGLDTGARAHAGEPFFTTKEPGHGMGLGLFLVRLLARRLKGSLRLESKTSGGTRATLTLAQGVPA